MFFFSKIRKIVYTPVNSNFYYIKVGFKGVKILWWYSTCVFIGCLHFTDIAYGYFCFELRFDKHESTKTRDINEISRSMFGKSEFLKCLVVVTLCCCANTNKHFLMYFNNTDFIWKVPRPEFHFWPIFMKFQHQEVQLHMPSTNVLDKSRTLTTI